MNYMNKPKKIRRISDGEIFSQNSDGTYSVEKMKEQFPDNIHTKWTYECLFSGINLGWFEAVIDRSPANPEVHIEEVVDKTPPDNQDPLETLASFNCDHVIFSGDDDQHCDKHPERGACCNSCWARRWAEDQLKPSHSSTVKLVDVDTTEEGILNPEFPLKGWRRYRIEYGGCNEDTLVEGTIYLPPSADSQAIVDLIMGMQAHEQIWKVVE